MSILHRRRSVLARCKACPPEGEHPIHEHTPAKRAAPAKRSKRRKGR